MSRADDSGLAAAGLPEHASLEPGPTDSAKVAEDIGVAALELAGRAHAAGLPAIGFHLESVALEAGAEAAARQWSAGVSEK